MDEHVWRIGRGECRANEGIGQILLKGDNVALIQSLE